MFTFKKILEIILEELELKRILINIPYGVSTRIASLLEFLPNPLLTKDQVEMLKKDNIISKKYDYRKTLEYLPMPFEKNCKNAAKFYEKKMGAFKLNRRIKLIIGQKVFYKLQKF